MKRNLIYLVCFIVLVSIVICGISLTNSNLPATEEVKEKATPNVYIKEDKPTAIYIQGNAEPVLRIEDLPKEFPPHVQHPEGARFPDTRFNLASLSPDGQRIAFSCGEVHTWVGLFELKNKKIHVINWLFDTSIDQILCSPNSQYFAYTYNVPSGQRNVMIIGFKQKTKEPYFSNRWSSVEDEDIISGRKKIDCLLINNLEWSKDGQNIQFEIQKCETRGLELIKKENEPMETIILKAIKGEAMKETLKKEKVKR